MGNLKTKLKFDHTLPVTNRHLIIGEIIVIFSLKK